MLKELQLSMGDNKLRTILKKKNKKKQDKYQNQGMFKCY